MVDLLIPGPEGKIEAKYNHNNNDNSPIALILHPDPSRGGTMNTKIVFQMYKIFVNNGFSTIRFNFRGVGKSVGNFDDGEGELSDAASVLDWLQQYNTNSKIVWVAGFSFGAWVAMQLLMRRPEINGFVSVSPPANLRDFSFLSPCPSSGLIVHGDKDNIASFDSSKILSEKLQKQKKQNIIFKSIKGADHFYENYKDQFTETVNNYIKEQF
jgi:alpha/beta superfamily hydrolase|tara:strand:- start:296 stop:931 length:636 start_codon:yes stop_codon:yes gene_type:complete